MAAAGNAGASGGPAVSQALPTARRPLALALALALDLALALALALVLALAPPTCADVALERLLAVELDAVSGAVCDDCKRRTRAGLDREARVCVGGVPVPDRRAPMLADWCSTLLPQRRAGQSRAEQGTAQRC